METVGTPVDAPAKINLFLEVLDKRPDGYHNVSLVSQQIGLADRISLVETGGDGDVIDATGPYASAVPCDPGINTVGRALDRMRREWPAIPPLEVVIEKNIPAGAGLGGGSADAAAVAMEVRRRYLRDVAAGDVVRVLAEVGSDMPFAAVGGTATVEGRGDRVTPVDFQFDSVRYVLVSPQVEVSTAWAYQALGEVKERPRRVPDALCAALREGDYAGLAEGVWNAFEAVVFSEHPELAGLLGMMEEAGCDAAWMTGSGSNLVGLCPGEERAAAAAKALEDATQVPVRVVRPRPAGARGLEV